MVAPDRRDRSTRAGPTSPCLILVKHSLPVIDPSIPASAWRLSPQGSERCAPLADRLAAYRPKRIFTSREPKAVETGQIVAARLGLPSLAIDDLHEHQRTHEPFTDRNTFEAGLKRFFSQPEKLVLGEETALQASKRFERAVRQLLARFPQETLILVSHGTVISLFYQSVVGKDPFPLWRQLELPSYLVFSLPECKLVEVVYQPTDRTIDHP